ncbi:MAG: nucleoside monophosphate kinase [Verrucomicrobia bacterium]|jgi:adenylate kinase|nr:nucleoside monophosphate kinase [Verrucomicrobiota bacterium]
MKYRAILLFGAPGSGKGTQGKILGAIPGFYHCSCGEVFRNLRPDSELGKVFLEYSSKGQLVPDEATIRLWHNYLDGSMQLGRFHPETDTLLLDGIPRNRRQAELMESALQVRGVIHLTCPEPEKLIQRLQRRAIHENRLDDANLEVIRKRFLTYESESKPVLDFYGPGKVHVIDATKTPIEVLQDILAVIVKMP